MRGSAAAAGIFLASLLAAASLPAEIRPSLPEGAYGTEVGAFFLCDQIGASLYYRFEGSSALRPLDRVLSLSALPGEERGYLIHVEARGPAGLLESASFSYLVDRRPPEPPQADRPGGVAKPDDRVSLSAPGADRILYSLVPGQADPQPYAGPIALAGRKDSILRYRLTAVALDKAGNVSVPLDLSFVVPAAGLAPGADLSPASAPPSSPPSGDPPSLSLDRGPSGLAVAFSQAQAASFLWAVLPSGSGATPGAWQALAATGGRASLEVPAPPGWVGGLSLVARSVDASGRASATSSPLAIDFPDQVPPSAGAGAPARLLALPGSRSAWLLADPGAGLLRWWGEDGVERDYTGPVFLTARERTTSLSVHYCRLLSDGRKTDERVLSLDLPADPGEPAIDGIPPSGVSADAITVSPSSKAIVLRYEIASAGAEPAPVGPASPVMEGPLRYAADPGATVPYRVRVRSYSSRDPSATASYERVFSFAVDRTPPQPPSLVEFPAPPGETAKYFGFKDSGDDVYYRVSRAGQALGGWQKFGAPIRLEPGAEGPVSYAISAYAVDLAGNRSSQADRQAITIDATSVYVAEAGSDKSDGSPTSPVRSLEMALRIAAATDRHRIRLSGAVRQGGDIYIEGDMTIEGGFDATWGSDPTARPSLCLRSLCLGSGRLSLSGLDLSSADAGADPFCRVKGGTLSLAQTNLNLSTSGEEAILVDGGATLSAQGSSICFKAKGKATAILVSGGELSLQDSSLSLSGADVGTAISADSGTVNLSQARVSCSSQGSSAAISVQDCAVNAQRSLVTAQASGGFSSCVMSRNAALSLSNDVLGVQGSAEGVLLDLSGGYLSLDQVTAYLRDCGRVAIGLRIRGTQVEARNSAFASFPPARTASLAEAALFDGRPDPKGIQALWAGGFGKMLRSDAADAFPGRVFTAAADSLFGFDAKGLPRLEASSPLIDRGVPLEGRPGGDWYGKPRPSAYGKGLPDVGAFEYQ